MANVSLEEIRKLREETGVGVMDCKRALMDSGGDFNQAKEILRKRGQKISEKRNIRSTKQGYIALSTNKDGNQAVLLELLCETDFVARTDKFRSQAESFARHALLSGISSLDLLLESIVKQSDTATVGDCILHLTASLGEKIQVGRFLFIKTQGTIVNYIHTGNQLVVLVNYDKVGLMIPEAKDIAMQIAAMKPLVVLREQISSSVIEKEIEIAEEQMIAEGKPKEIAVRAAKGKLNKFFQEKVLYEQQFIKDSSITVKQFTQRVHLPKIIDFYRIEIGEA